MFLSVLHLTYICLNGRKLCDFIDNTFPTGEILVFHMENSSVSVPIFKISNLGLLSCSGLSIQLHDATGFGQLCSITSAYRAYYIRSEIQVGLIYARHLNFQFTKFYFTNIVMIS